MRWKNQYIQDKEHSFPGKGKLKPEDEELRRFKRKNADLKEEKSLGHHLKTPKMKYMFIHNYYFSFRVKKMCRVLDISRSGYYGWKKKTKSARTKKNEHLLDYIEKAYMLRGIWQPLHNQRTPILGHIMWRK